jgi:hypothetical protein
MSQTFAQVPNLRPMKVAQSRHSAIGVPPVNVEMCVPILDVCASALGLMPVPSNHTFSQTFAQLPNLRPKILAQSDCGIAGAPPVNVEMCVPILDVCASALGLMPVPSNHTISQTFAQLPNLHPNKDIGSI